MESPRQVEAVTEDPHKCPKCGGMMAQGFVIDFTQGTRLVSKWAPGPPEKSFWLGTKLPQATTIPIGAFRCDSCGFLEHYARTEFEAR